MSKRRLLVIGLLFGSIVTALGYYMTTAFGAAQERDWTPFTMTYRSEAPQETIIGRLQWHSKWDWSLEIKQDDVNGKASGDIPLINYQGTRYEFKNGLYTVYGTDGSIQSQTPIEKGVFMSPSQWLVPGFDIQLTQRQGFSESIQGGGQMHLRSEEKRSCPRNPDGSAMDETCAPSQLVETEYIFSSKGIPLSRSLRVAGQTVEQWTVLEIKDQ